MLTARIPQLGDFVSLEQLKGLNAATGGHFFDKGSVAFFRSKAYAPVYPGRDGWYFVTSEQFQGVGEYSAFIEPRRYTVRVMRADGSIDTVGGFQDYATLRAARRAAQKRAVA